MSKPRMNRVNSRMGRPRLPPEVNDELIRLYNEGLTRTQICERLDISLCTYDSRTRALRKRGIIKWNPKPVEPVTKAAPERPRYKAPADACDVLLARLIEVYGPRLSTFSK